MEVSESSMKGWYELRGQDVYIWEGLLVLYNSGDMEFQLFKIMDGELFEICVDLRNLIGVHNPLNFKSDGYWQCAEIQGTLSTGQNFLCHSTDQEHAFKILKVLPSAITSISIRLDPNPFRNWSCVQIEERLGGWEKLLKQFCEFPENTKLILDSNMLN